MRCRRPPARRTAPDARPPAGSAALHPAALTTQVGPVQTATCLGTIHSPSPATRTARPAADFLPHAADDCAPPIQKTPRSTSASVSACTTTPAAEPRALQQSRAPPTPEQTPAYPAIVAALPTAAQESLPDAPERSTPPTASLPAESHPPLPLTATLPPATTGRSGHIAPHASSIASPSVPATGPPLPRASPHLSDIPPRAAPDQSPAPSTTPPSPADTSPPSQHTPRTTPHAAPPRTPQPPPRPAPEHSTPRYRYVDPVDVPSSLILPIDPIRDPQEFCFSLPLHSRPNRSRPPKSAPESHASAAQSRSQRPWFPSQYPATPQFPSCSSPAGNTARKSCGRVQHPVHSGSKTGTHQFPEETRQTQFSLRCRALLSPPRGQHRPSINGDDPRQKSGCARA